MKINRISVTFLTVLALTAALASCGDNSQNETTGEDQAQPAAPAEKADDGKGIGPVKSLKLGPIDEEMAAQGKLVFEAKCVSCHKVTDEKYVGPGLKGITERRKPEWIMNMILNPQEMTQKDPTAKKLLAEHLTQMVFQDVTEEETRAILEYFRLNDQQ